MKPTNGKQPGRKMKNQLNERQERFCEFVAAGETLADAYLKAGFKTTRENARKNATRMTANDDIKNRIKELRKSVPDIVTARMTKEEKLTVLAKIIRSPFDSQEVKINDILRAIELHSKMMGHFEPDRTELQVGSSTLQSIKKRAREVGYTLSRRYQTTNQVRSSANCNTEVQ
jgi:hypothetical protein